MSKTEKVRIDLHGKPSDPPVKIIKPRNMNPVSDAFRVTPKYMPFLSQNILQVTWNAAEKTLSLEIRETPNFDAYRWFGTINKRLAESQKSSFVDLEQDSILIHFEDGEGKDVAAVKFRGLKLVEHHCYMGKQTGFGIDSPGTPLSHSVNLRYTDSEMMPVHHIEDEDRPLLISPEESNEIVDEEWQTVSL